MFARNAQGKVQPDRRLHLKKTLPIQDETQIGKGQNIRRTQIQWYLYKTLPTTLHTRPFRCHLLWVLVHPKYLKITMKGKVKQLYSSVVATSCRLAEVTDGPLDFWFLFNKVLLEPHSVAGYNAPVFYKHLLNFYYYHYWENSNFTMASYLVLQKASTNTERHFFCYF